MLNRLVRVFAVGRLVLAGAAAAAAFFALAAPAAAQTPPVLPAQSAVTIFYGNSFTITPVADGPATITYAARFSDGTPTEFRGLYMNRKTGKIDAIPFGPIELIATLSVDVQATDTGTGLKSQVQRFELVLADHGGSSTGRREISVVGTPTGSAITMRIPLDPSLCGHVYDRIQLYLIDKALRTERNRSPIGHTDVNNCGSHSHRHAGWDVSYNTAGRYVEFVIRGRNFRTSNIQGEFIKGNNIVGNFLYVTEVSPQRGGLAFLDARDPVTLSIDENQGSSLTAPLTDVGTVSASDNGTISMVRYSLSGPHSDDFCVAGIHSKLCGASSPNGMIRVADDVNFDYERKSSYTLTLQACVFRQRTSDSVTGRRLSCQEERPEREEISKQVIVNINDIAETAPVFQPAGSDLFLTPSVSLPVGSAVLTLSVTSTGGTVGWGVSQSPNPDFLYRIEDGPGSAADTYLATVFIDAKRGIGFALLVRPHFIEISAANSGDASGTAVRQVFFNYTSPPSFNAKHLDRRYAAGNFRIHTHKAYDINPRRGTTLGDWEFPGYSATLPDGSALPSWLQFGRDDGGWVLVATSAPAGTLMVRINALDGEGAVAVYDDFTIDVVSAAGREPIRVVTGGGGSISLDENDPFRGTFEVAIGAAPVGASLVLEVRPIGSDKLQLRPSYLVFPVGATGSGLTQMVVVSIVAGGRNTGSHSANVRVKVLDPSQAPANYLASEAVTVALTWTNAGDVQPAGGDEAMVDDAAALEIGEIDFGIAAAAVNLIGQRIMMSAPPESSLAPAAGDGQVQLLSAAQMWALWRRQEDAEADGRMRRLGLREFIHERGLDFGLSSSGSAGPRTRLWGSGSIVSLDGNPVVQGEELSYDGDVNILMLGVEAVRGDNRLGLVVASSNAEVDFGENGSVEREMTSIHPYLSWRPRYLDARVWLSAGLGGGPFVNERGGGKHSRDGDYVMFAGGLSGSWERDEYDLFLTGKAFTGTSELEASDALGLAKTEAKSWRLEAEVRAERDFSLLPEEGISLRPFVSIDGRRDRSDAALLNAFDVGGGVQVNWDLGMRLEVSGRWQASDEVTNENSFGGNLSYDFGSDGKGLLVSLAPEVVRSQEEDAPIAFRRTLRSRLGYARAVRIFGHSALMKVSADATYGSDGGSRDYGWQLTGRRTQLGVSASASGTYRLDWSWR